MEKIGNIEIKELVLDSEEKIEHEYFDILEKVKGNSLYFEEELMNKKNTWIELKELLKYRKNIIDWIPINDNAQVLEIMSGAGALTEILSLKAKSLTCLECSKTKSLINAYRNQNCDNVEIYVSDYETFCEKVNKKYDYIIWIDGFADYKKLASKFADAETLLKSLKMLLKDNGKIVCATNNPFGLRYFAGCPDELTGQYFEGICGYPDTESELGYTREDFITLFQKSDYKNIECYYPYPDYMFPVAIYSDERMPAKGELWMNMCNFQQERLVLFDEERVYDNIIEHNMFGQYSNSYLIIAERE